MASSSGCAPEPVVRSLRDAGGRVGRSSLPEGSGTDERPSAQGSPQEADRPLPVHRFPRALRLTSRRQFQSVYAHGLRASSPCFAVFGKPNGLEHSRLGLTLTRKTGGAVERNRAKRVLREVFRLNRHRIALPMDVVVNGRRKMLEQTTQRVEREFLDCVGKLARRAAQ